MSSPAFSTACLRGAVLALVVNSSSVAAQQPVPVRDLGATRAKSAETLGAIFGVHQFADGSVLVSDAVKRRLLLFDSTLTHVTVLADSGGTGAARFGPRTSLIPARGDSVFVVDFTTQSLLLRAGAGPVVRAVAPPKAQDFVYFLGGGAGLDARGGLVYRGVLRPPPRIPGTLAPPPIDSAPIVRGDFDTRRVDTIAMLKTRNSGPPMELVRGSDGKVSFRNVYNPLSYADEWGMMADGSVAIVRGQDYHIDWINTDGTRSSSPKLAYDWKRLTDEDKQKLVDSTRLAMEALNTGGGGGLTEGEVAVASGRLNFSIGDVRWVVNADGSKTAPVAVDFVPLSEIIDYIPPLRSGSVRGDADNNLWILPTTSARSRKGGLVYDIVNRNGVLVERVEIPAGRTIAGFGRGGVVYLAFGDLKQGFLLERANFR